MTSTDKRRIKVLVLIPTLEVGGAEMDLARTLPRLDRSRFEVVVCAFLAFGALAQPLLDAGIEVIGPIGAAGDKRGPHGLRSRLRSLVSAAVSVGRGIAGALPAPMRRACRRSIAFCRGLVPLRIESLAWLRRLRGRAAVAISYLRIGIAISTHVRSREIDVVHAILPNSYVVGGIAAVLTRRPLAMSRVSLNWYRKQYPLLHAVERRLLHRVVVAAICNSAAVRQELIAEGLASSKIRLIRNGIDVQGFSAATVDREQARARFGIGHDALVFSLVASIRPYKGHADLLQAMQLVRDRLPAGWVLLAAGRDIDGHLDRMQRLADDLGLSAHARFLGERDDIAAILRAADIHVSASHTEGFPNNILEAMCTGLPVIATAVGGVPEMVVDGQTGLLVPPRDPAAMARALDALSNDPERRTAMGEAGRSLVSSFSLERCAGALERVYADIAPRF